METSILRDDEDEKSLTEIESNAAEDDAGGGKSVYGIFFANNKNKFPGGLKKQAFFQNLRHQLLEQVKSLESRLESQLSITTELSDYFKKRSDVEIEFAKMLEKLFNHKQKQRKDNWSPGMLNGVLVHLMNDTKREAKERLVLSEICTQIVNRLALINEDLTRIFKQCQLVCGEGQEELLKVLHELYTSSKSYQSYRQEWKLAEGKLKLVEAQKAKVEIGLQSKEKIEKSKKVKTLDKEILKRLRKSNDSKFKALKAKNEYILCMDAANAAVQKYFVDDLSDLIDCMDLGYYESVGNALKLYVASEETKADSVKSSIETLEKLVITLDSRVDKQKFLEAHNSAFVLPKKFEIDRDSSDEEEKNEDNLETPLYLHEELEGRMHLLERRLGTLRMESNELWKTLETAETSLLNLIGNLQVKKDQVRDCFTNNDLSFFNNNQDVKQRTDRLDVDQFHINKYRDYMLCTNRISRLEAKYEHIRSALKIRVDTVPSPQATTSSSLSSDQMKRRKRIGKCSSVRLFGGSLEEYLEVNKVQIPLIVKSCIRVLNLYGLHHQGLFRVSGSQLEIGNFRDAFERGEDPLAEMNDADINNASDINSVASLLKLYLRELREPLFPIVFFDIFMEIAQLDSNVLFISRMRDLVMKSLPRSVFVVLRYLFHFLNHLSEYSDENMMDPYNLAICFGPTLVPVPEDKDQVQYQNLVNELIKNVIVYAHEIFVNDAVGEVYEKFWKIDKSSEPIEDDDDDLKTRTISTNSDASEVESSMSSVMFGTARYDFKARSPRELSFKKGEVLTLHCQISSDWWKGRVLDKPELGLIPHKYIHIGETVEEAEPPPPKVTVEKKVLSKARKCETVEIASSSPKPQKLDEQLTTPDLVMDLPSDRLTDITALRHTDIKSREITESDLKTSSPGSMEEAGPSSLSPTPEISNAEVFAQEQCTLKKPQIKTKPQVSQKPKLPPIILKEENNTNEKIND